MAATTEKGKGERGGNGGDNREGKGESGGNGGGNEDGEGESGGNGGNNGNVEGGAPRALFFSFSLSQPQRALISPPLHQKEGILLILFPCPFLLAQLAVLAA